MKINSLRHRLLLLAVIGVLACKKSADPAGQGPALVLPEKETPAKPDEPEIASTIGFFIEGWIAKTFVKPEHTAAVKPSADTAIDMSVDMSDVITKVSLNLFGNNANPYMTQIINQPVLLDHIKSLNPHVLRFPGGNLSSVYFWNKEPGNKPVDAPAMLYDSSGQPVNASYWVGKDHADWTLSLDNFYRVLAETKTTGIITVNYGYARYGTSDHPAEVAAHLAADWVRYDKGRSKFWEIGNESGGPWQAGFKINKVQNKDGQPEIINGGIYGKHFKIFADSMRKAASEVGGQIKIGAQLIGTDASNSWNIPDRDWNSRYFEAAGDAADFYIVHDYYDPIGVNSNAATVLNTPVNQTRSVMEWMKTSTQRAGVPLKPIAMTEWNIGAEGSKQMVSHISGMQSIIVLGELIKNKFGEANRWGLANGWANGNDHGMFYKGDDEPGNPPLWNPRPAFYQMYLFQKYFGDRMVNSQVSNSSDILSYASSYSSGEAGMVLVNKGMASKVVNVKLNNFQAGEKYYWYTLTGGNDNGEFSRKVFINGIGPEGESGGPLNYKQIPANSALVAGGIRITLPARSVVYLVTEDFTQ